MGLPIRDKRINLKRVPIDSLFSIGMSQCGSGSLLALFYKLFFKIQSGVVQSKGVLY